MRKAAVAVALVILVSEGPASAQGAPGGTGRTTELALGVVSYDVRDQVLNPLAHHGRLASLGIMRERRDESATRRFDVEIVASPLHSRFESGWASLATDLRLAYRGAAQVAEPLRGVSLRLGGAVDATSHLAYFHDWDNSHVYWLTAYSVGLDAVAERWGGDGHGISVEARMPLLSLVSRPEAPVDYKVVNPDFGWILGKIHEGLSPALPGEHLALDVAVRYRRPTARWGRSLYWQLMYVHSDLEGSATLDIVRHTVGVTVGL